MARRLWEHAGRRPGRRRPAAAVRRVLAVRLVLARGARLLPRRARPTGSCTTAASTATRPAALPALSGGGALGNGRMHGVPADARVLPAALGPGRRPPARPAHRRASPATPRRTSAARSSTAHVVTADRLVTGAADVYVESCSTSLLRGEDVCSTEPDRRIPVVRRRPVGRRRRRPSRWRTRPTSPWSPRPASPRWPRSSGRSSRPAAPSTTACGPTCPLAERAQRAARAPRPRRGPNATSLVATMVAEAGQPRGLRRGRAARHGPRPRARRRSTSICSMQHEEANPVPVDELVQGRVALSIRRHEPVGVVSRSRRTTAPIIMAFQKLVPGPDGGQLGGPAARARSPRSRRWCSAPPPTPRASRRACSASWSRRAPPAPSCSPPTPASTWCRSPARPRSGGRSSPRPRRR